MSLERVVQKTLVRRKDISCDGPQIRMCMTYRLSKSAKADVTVHVHPSTLRRRRGRGSQGPADFRTLLERPIFRILASLFHNRYISSFPFTHHNERNTSEALTMRRSMRQPRTAPTERRRRRVTTPDGSSTVHVHGVQTLKEPLSHRLLTFMPNRPATRAPEPMPSVPIDT
jgi:hypothetical protein